MISYVKRCWMVLHNKIYLPKTFEELRWMLAHPGTCIHDKINASWGKIMTELEAGIECHSTLLQSIFMKGKYKAS